MAMENLPIRVLLIDDDGDDCMRIRRLLSGLFSSGSSLRRVADHEAALSAIQDGEYDVCLLDYRMENRSGLEFLKEVRRRGHVIPIIFLTGPGDYRLDIKAMIAGAASYLTKEHLTAPLLERSILYAVERKEKREELLKAKRVIQALSECNHAVIHLKDETELLREICRIVVEVGGYRMAWVGYAEQDEDRTVTPVAGYGHEEGYLETVRITWRDTELGRGPMGTPIRTGAPSIFRNIISHPDFAPWRDEAVKRGYFSVIGLPLFLEGRVMGSLGIYASEPDAFGTEEIELFIKLASNLSYGIEALRVHHARMQAEASLRKAEEKYRSIFENALEGIYQSTRDGRYTEVNPSFARIFGYDSPEDLKGAVNDIGRQIYQDPARREECIRIAMERGKAIFEVRINRKDGSKGWVSNSVQVIRDRDGNLSHFEGVVEDITERKRAEEALNQAHETLERRVEERTIELTKINWMLEQQKEILQTILDNIPVMIAMFDPSGHLEFMNHEAERLLGCRLEEAEEIDLLSACCPDRGKTSQSVPEPCLGGVPKWRDHAFKTCKGEPLDSSWSSVRLSNGTMIGIGIDTAERKRAENILRESEERFRLSLEGSQVGVWDWNVQTGAIVSFRNWAQILGYPEDEIESNNSMWERSLHPDDRERVMDSLNAHLEGKTPLYESAYRLRAKSGEWKWILGKAKVIAWDSEGKPLRAVGIHIDVTARKEAEQALRESEMLLRSLSSKLLSVQEEERKRIAGELHDTIGQTLAAVKYWVETIIQSKDTIDIEEVMKRLQMFVPTLQRSIEETRTIYMGLRPTMLDSMGVTATLMWFCREFMKLYPKLHIELQIDIEEHAIPEHLKIVIFRIVQEALNNVAKHSKAEWVDLTLSRNEDSIELAILDDGVGVDPSEIPAKAGSAGSLGLTGMMERAELTGGTFSFTSGPGEGTAIRASWPIGSE